MNRNTLLKKLSAMLLALALLMLSSAQTDALAVTTGTDLITTGTDIPSDPVLPPDDTPAKGALSISGASEVRGGGKVTLTASLDGAAISPALVDWAVYPYNTSLCTISQGTVITKKVTYPQTVQVTAVLKADPTIYTDFVLTIRPAVTKVTIEAPSTYVDLTNGATLQLQAVLSPEECIGGVTWTSSSAGVATVSADGLVTGHKTGKVVITARANDGSGVSGSITLQVVRGVTGLAINGPSDVAEGKTISLSAVTQPGDASVKDVVWSVDCDSSVAVITAAGKLTAKKVDAITVVTVKVTSKQNPGIFATHVVTIRPVVDRLTIVAPGNTIDLDSADPTMRLTVTSEPADASTEVTWSSSSKSIATVDENGVVTALKTGSVTITAKASDGSGKTAKITLKVIRAVKQLEISGPTSVAAGKTITLKATITPDNASNGGVLWELDCNSNVAVISTAGKLTAKKGITEPINVVVTATSKENPAIFDTYSVTVRPAVTKMEIVAPQNIIDFSSDNKTMQLTAICTPSGASQQVTWTSSKPSVATVDENGLVTALKTGKVTITAKATDGSGKTAKITIEVVRAVKGVVISGPTEVAAGETITLKAAVMPEDASNQAVTWSLDCSSEVATITTAGKLTAKKNITERVVITVTATSKENTGMSGTHRVIVCPVVDEIVISAPQTYIDFSSGDKTLQLTAACLPADASQNVRWTSSAPSIATVDENGLVTAVKTGKTTITAYATDGSDTYARITISVVKAVQGVVIEGPTQVASGKSITLKASVMPEDASNQKVEWAVNCDSSVATISSSGVLRAASGVTEPIVLTVTATSVENSAMVGVYYVTVCPAVTKIEIVAPQNYIDFSSDDKTLLLTAVCTPADASQQVTWSSGNTSRATVDENGLVTALKTGSVTITAKATDGSGKSASITINIVRAVQGVVIEGATEVASGSYTRLKAYVMPENASNQAVIWSVDCDSSIATISDSGRLTAVKGLTERVTVTVTAASKENPALFATHQVTICPVVSEITIIAPQTYIDFSSGDKTLQLTAVCKPEQASQEVSWTSGSKTIATVDENGLVTALKTGKVTITARAKDGSGKTARITIDVVRAVQGVVIEGSDSLASGKTITLDAYVTPENASNQAVIWSVDCDSSIAAITSAGKLTAKKGLTDPVVVTVTATSAENPAMFATHQVTIRPAVERITIEAPQTFIDLDAGDPTLQLAAICTPDDAAQQVSWTSSKPSVATVDENGLVTALKIGTTTITAKATDGTGVKASVTISVVRAVQSISITGSTELASGKRITMKAAVLPENATNREVTWSVDCDSSIATISTSGRLTAASGITEPVVVTVTATSKENPAIFATHQVTIRPAVTKITITAPQSFIDFDTDNKTLQLAAVCTPENASQQVVWSSSKPNVATVDENGLVTAHKIGKVTITATAVDGTNRSASITISIVTAARSVTISGATSVVGGNNILLTATVLPAEASNKKVTWSIDCDSSVATISTTGRLYAKKVSASTTVTVTAISQENPALYDTHTVTIRPAVGGVVINAPRTWIDITSSSPTLQLSAHCTPATSGQGVSWRSDNTSVATVDSNGKVTGVSVGTANIIARATDGSGRYKSVMIRVLKPVTDITITGSHYVQAGYTLRLRYTIAPADASVKRLEWTSSNTSVATVTNGIVSAKDVSEAQSVVITATTTTGPKVSCSYVINVLPKGAAVPAAE